jgi:O-antigen/teichoic acid export membrane protein
MTTSEQPKPAPTLLRQISHYSGAQIATMAAGFISMPILTRVLGTARYGTMSLVATMLILMSGIAKLGLSHATIRFAGRPKEGREDEERALQSSLILASLVPTLVTIGVVEAAAFFYRHHHGGGSLERTIGLLMADRYTAGLMMLASLILLARTLVAIVWALQRSEGRSNSWTALSITLRYGSLLVSIGALLIWHTLAAYLIGMLVAETAVVGWYTGSWWKSHRLGFRLFSPALVKPCLVYGLPMVVYEIASVVVAYCDKFIIIHFWNKDALGLYAAGYGVAETLPTILAFPIELAITPYCFKLWEQHGAERTAEFLSRSAARYAIVVFPVLALFCVATRAIVGIMGGHDFAGSAPVVPWVLAGLALWCGFYPIVGMGFLIRKKTASFTGIMLIAVVLNAGLNWLVVPRMGYIGSAIATFVTYAAMLVMTGIGSRRYLRVHWQLASLGRAAVFSVGIAALVYMIPINYGIAATLLRLVVGTVLYLRIVTPLDANARWVVEAIGKWLREHSVPVGWLRAVTGTTV